MAPKRRYAEGTTVDVSKSRIEIETLLVRGGATQLVVGFDVQSRGFVHFTLDGRQYRILLPQRPAKRNAAQVDRENWRTLVAPRIAEIYDSGTMVPLLPEGA